MSDSTQERVCYIFLRMRYRRLAGEPEVYASFDDASSAFEEYTGTSWEDVESLGADPDDLLGEPFLGTRILEVEIPPACPSPIAA